MRRVGSTAIALMLLAVSGPGNGLAGEDKLPPDRAPSLMTPTEIRAYNDGLDPAHPYYIRCKKDPVVGSLVRKLRVCRTNEQWKQFLAAADVNSREIMDDMTRGSVSGEAPAFDACPANHC